MLMASIARCGGQAPTDIPPEADVVKRAEPDQAAVGADLQDLMGELDTLIEEA